MFIDIYVNTTSLDVAPIFTFLLIVDRIFLLLDSQLLFKTFSGTKSEVFSCICWNIMINTSETRLVRDNNTKDNISVFPANLFTVAAFAKS